MKKAELKMSMYIINLNKKGGIFKWQLVQVKL